MTESYDEGFVGRGSNQGLLSLPPEIVPNMVTLGMNQIDQGWRTRPIEYSIESAREISNEVSRMLDSPVPEFYICSKRITSLYGNEIKRFGMSLVGYQASYKPLVPIKFLLNGIMDKEFCQTLKKMRVCAWTRRFKAQSNEDDGLDQYYMDSFSKLEDIGQIYNYKYWLNWVEPDPEDWKFGLVKPYPTPNEIKEQWKASLREVLPDSISMVHPEEVLLALSSSAARDWNGKPTKVFRDKADPSKNTLTRHFLRGWRTTIQKGPTEVRDCLTLPISLSNTVKYIEKQCAEIASKTKFSAFGKGPEEFEKQLDSFYELDKHYYNRDLTKEGITKPRWILKACQEVFREKYPDNPCWDYMDIYDKYELNVDGTWYSLPTGHGLGMANALTTIMQCASFHWVLHQSDEIEDGFDALFYNDDATIKGPDDVAVLTFSEIEDDMLRKLGLLPKQSKTYSSQVCILCERYYPKYLSTKDSSSKYIRRLVFSATNIVVAKAFFHCIDDPCFGAFEPALLPMALQFWGCEWSAEEYSLPAFAGGWCAPKFKGVHLDFLDELPHSQLLYRGIQVGPPRLKPKVFQKEDGYFTHPILGSNWIDHSKIDPRAVDLFDFFKPMSDMAAKFHRSLDDDVTYKWFRRQLVDRFLIWSKPAKPMDTCEIYEKVVKDNPLSDWLPPWEYCKELPLESVCGGEGRGSDPPRQPNKLLGAIAWFSGIFISKVIPYPYLPTGEAGDLYLTPERLSKYQESILALPGVSKINLPTRDFKLEAILKERHYVDDYAVVEAWVACTGRYTYPRPLIRSVGGQIKHEGAKVLELMEYRGTQAHWDFWTTYGRTTPIFHMFNVFTDSEWEDIFEMGESQDELGNTQKEKDNSNLEVEHVDFWTWRSNRNLPVPRQDIDIYVEVDNLLTASEIFKSLHNLQDDRSAVHSTELVSKIPPEGSFFDLLYKRFTKVAGIYYFGVYIYSPPDMLDAWGGSNEDEAGGFGDLFG